MRLHNTLSGQKEEFIPQNDTVKMYVCGVTPYDSCHLGHAMSYIVFDMIRRYLEFRGYKVKCVQNFTDIDDKIISRASERGVPPEELAEGFIDQYFADMDALNVMPADHYPRATGEVPKIIEVIEGLVQKGYAYEVGGDVYFRVKRGLDYGKLSHRNLDDMLAGYRIEVNEAKEHPLDFALWKAAKPGEPQWQSPWGQGRPGWHIECSAMSLKYLGETLDIHGGGQDLIFPHHENETAQSESFTGVMPFVRYWLHNGLMQLGEDKMSKSTGKLVTVREALDRYGADAIRLWVLNSHYRSPIIYSEEALEATEKGVERLRRSARAESEGTAKAGIDAQSYREQFVEAMDDDFNSPQATAVLFDLAREINRGYDEKLDIGEARKSLRELAGVLGLTLEEPGALELPVQPLVGLIARYDLHLEMDMGDEQKRAILCIELLSDKRDELRRDKRWQLADSIRNDLKELGITLEDTPRGTMWRYKKP
ncbi:MAG: cysteine--tRNA ligase [Dehalococcoidia bacterium]